MLKVIISCVFLMAVAADWTGDWGLDRINPFTRQQTGGIVPQRDYSTQSSNFNRFVGQMDPFPQLGQMIGAGHLPVDIRETANGIDILIDLPGASKDDISVTIYRNNELRIWAYKHGLFKTEDSRMQRSERYYGEVSRTLIFPEHADLEHLEAKYEDGVLWIKIPRNPNVAENAPHSVQVN